MSLATGSAARRDHMTNRVVRCELHTIEPTLEQYRRTHTEPHPAPHILRGRTENRAETIFNLRISRPIEFLPCRLSTVRNAGAKTRTFNFWSRARPGGLLAPHAVRPGWAGLGPALCGLPKASEARMPPAARRGERLPRWCVLRGCLATCESPRGGPMGGAQ